MVNRTFDLSQGAGELRLQSGDAVVQLVHGEGIEILATERGQRIVRAAGQAVVGVHGVSVDPPAAAVNNRIGRGETVWTSFRHA